MASSNSTQPTIAEEVEKRLRTQKIAAMVQTRSEVTPLPSEREAAFRTWIKRYNVTDLDESTSHYDYRGAFLAGAIPNTDGQWPEAFQQHGHPTFSPESRYALAADFPSATTDTLTPSVVEPSDPAATAFRRIIEAGDPELNALRAFKQSANLGNDHAVRAFRRFEPDTQAVFDSMQQRPSFPIQFPETEHPGQLGPEDVKTVVLGAAQQLKEVVTGTLAGMRETFAVAGSPQPVVPHRLPQLSEQEQREIRMAAAFVTSSIVGGAAPATILRGLAPSVVRSTLAGTTAGAAFGALRPRGKEESLLGAIAVDAALFGGMSLAAGMVGKATKPLKLDAEVLEAAGVKVHPRATTPVEHARGLFEEMQNISEGLKLERHVADPLDEATALRRAGATPEELQAQFAERYATRWDAAAARGETMPLAEELGAVADLPHINYVSHPANLGLIRMLFGSPSHYARNIPGPVGEMFGRVVDNAVKRKNVEVRLRGEWDAVLGEAEDLITQDIKRLMMGGTLTEPARVALIRERKFQLGKLLDNVFQPTDLPVTVSKPMSQAFELMRNRYLADREFFKLRLGDVPDWGFDAYLAHVHLGNVAIINANTKAVLAITTPSGVKKSLAEIAGANPSVPLTVMPKEFLLPAEFAGFGLTGRQLGIFTSRVSRAFSIDRDEVASVLFENRIARVKPGKKFFGHLLPRREQPLPGWELDPFLATRIYAAGAARNIAYHDFAQKAGAIADHLAATTRGTETSVAALRTYVDRVLGKPSQAETFVREWGQDLARRFTAKLTPGIQQFAEEVADPRNLARLITTAEANMRLGYSPVAWLAQMSQTWVNTASHIGYGPTGRGIRMLLDRTQHTQVDALLRAMDIDVTVPITMAEQILTRQVGSISPFHPLYFFNKLSVANKAIAALAKYQQEILSHGNIRKALEEGRKFGDSMEYNYTVADAPRLLAGPLGASMFQFRKYTLKTLEIMHEMRNQPLVLARFHLNILALVGIAGLMALPPYMLLDVVTGKLTGETITERVQAEWPRASRGLAGAAGIDLGQNIAIGLPRDVGDVFGPGATDLWAIGVKLLPKATIDLIKGKQGFLTPEERGRIIAQLAPSVARRLFDAYDILDKDVVAARGTHTLKFRPEDAEREAFLTALGFRSIERADEQRIFTTEERIETLHRQEETAVLQALVDAYLEGDFTRFTELRIQASEDHLVLTASQLQDAIQRTMVERTLRSVKTAPRELRPKALERALPVITPP